MLLSGTESRPTSFLLVARNDDGLYEGSYWRLRRPGETAPPPPQSLVDRLHEQGFLPAGGARARRAWLRRAARTETLDDLCYTLLHDDPAQPWETVAAYLHAAADEAGSSAV